MRFVNRPVWVESTCRGQHGPCRARRVPVHRRPVRLCHMPRKPLVPPCHDALHDARSSPDRQTAASAPQPRPPRRPLPPPAPPPAAAGTAACRPAGQRRCRAAAPPPRIPPAAAAGTPPCRVDAHQSRVWAPALCPSRPRARAAASPGRPRRSPRRQSRHSCTRACAGASGSA